MPKALKLGLAFLPLRDEDIDSFIKLPQTRYFEGFNYLSSQLSSEIAKASKGGAIVYFETKYFGGAGAQGVAFFSDGVLTYGPKSADSGPINKALRLVGVAVIAPAIDEFETIGLNRYRHTQDWLGDQD